MRSPRGWLHGATLVAATLLAFGADAADPAPGAPLAADATAQPAYRVVINAPPTLQPVIERSVGLVRWRAYADMTAELLDRLAREAIDEARDAAATEGYFAAQVESTVDRGAIPVTVTLTVTPGEVTRVADVRIDVTGPATTDVPLGTAAIARISEEWGLPKGEVFRQTAWSAAKERALATLRASPFAAATIVGSEATIDPGARAGDLSLELASGPAFRFGDMQIDGLVKFRPSIVRNYSPILRGEPYGAAPLDQFIRRLNATGYFSSVQASIDPDTAHADEATVRVAVIEAPTRSFEGGIGYSTDVRYTAKVNYRDVSVDGNGLQMLIDGQLDGKTQSGSLRLVQPANEAGWIGAWGLGTKRTDIEGLVTETAIAGTRWHTLEERRERALSATFYQDDQTSAGEPTIRSRALYLEAEQYWREVDNLLAPTRGFMASVQLGGGIPGVSTRGFGRIIGRFAGWLPLDRSTQINVRGDAGAVLASTRDRIPSTLLFRTGGDTTVRGYAFESLGVDQGNAVVGGRYYAVGSIEAIRWIGDSWGLAAFIDAGNAGDSLPNFRLALGYGVGARIRTPLGPFRLDIAYGEDVHEVRLHFSVGLSF